jgi:hypothetical protein
MDARELQSLVDAADPAALLLAVDGLCASREWDLLELLGQRCRQAVEMGRQLWGVAMHCDYRLAWEGPAEHAARTLQHGAGRFTLGPLTEVAASTHDWASLAPHLRDPVIRSTVAQERVLRGEDLAGEADVEMASLPSSSWPWEPAYALPSYRDRSAKFAEPEAAVRHVPLDEELPGPADWEEDAASDALREVARVWWEQSAGSARAVSVSGDARAALSALRGRGRAGLLRISPGEGIALLQWAGASGGAYGRRPGGAAGRFAAWWTAAALAGLDWPEGAVPSAFADELGAAVGELEWYRWAGPESSGGWALRLAVADPADGLAWAVEAVDHREDDDDPDELD